ncbi:YcxB family protein [Consotaella aegiceratis]|uniref:YcxB family protein n=1 Tax=Consotaella aegiceratis TaxID=3097961 RepID=UPI002F425D34
MGGSGVPKIWRTSAGPTFTKQFELSLDDHMAVRHGTKGPLPLGPFCALITLCTLGIGLAVAFGPWKKGNWWAVAGIMAGAAAAGPLLSWLLYRFFRGLIKGFWEGFLEVREAVNVPFEMTVDASGVSVLVRQQSWFCPWDSLQDVEEDGERYYFWLSNTTAHVLPKRLFDDDERAEFDSALRDWLGHAPVSPPRRVGSKIMNWGKPEPEAEAEAEAEDKSA